MNVNVDFPPFDSLLNTHLKNGLVPFLENKLRTTISTISNGANALPKEN